MSGRQDRERGAGIRVSLPATSANLGPGFDAVGVALSLELAVDAWPALHDRVKASGRNADVCGRLEDNLILRSYREVLKKAGKDGPPLHLEADNQIPLGMGCGSSAAARLAGVALADRFGELGMSGAEIVAQATRLEGHPDNVAACWYGGFTVSVSHRGRVEAATFACDGTWQLLLALPAEGLATEKARGVLPSQYDRADAIFNVQRTALLTAAFAQARLDLLRVAMGDRLHQPFRREVCGLLQHLEELAAAPEFAGVALSGAGPALLTILSERATLHGAEERLRSLVTTGIELLPVRIAGPARVEAI